MKTLSLLVLSTAVLFSAPSLGAEQVATYGIHLFFDETEFVDVLTLTTDAAGRVKGHMHVPNDFDADVRNLRISGERISFDLDVPKNSARPRDLVFHYEGTFFDSTRRQLVGFVNVAGETGFTASFVGFLRAPAERRE